MTGQYNEGIAILYPIANAPLATASDRQTLALIYGLKGDTIAAARLARMDLGAAAVQHNLAYYETLRRLSPAERAQAVLSASGGPQALGRS